MRIEEIESQIATNRNAMRELQNQISGLSIKTSELERLKEDDKLKTFVEYIEVGSTYEFHSYTYLTGVESGSKTGLQSNFIKGDVIEIVKKNKMSIVIKCIKKISSTRDSNNMRVLSESNPNAQFRIDIQSLFINMIRDSQFSDGLKTYQKRKEALDELGI
jgi:hypothetical protein